MRRTRDGVGLVESKRVTGTRIGGAGLVPAGRPWPRTAAGYPLDFIALIDFAKLPHIDPLPRAGRLALYYGGNPDDPQFLDPAAAAARTTSRRAHRRLAEGPPRSYPFAATHLRGRLMSFSGDAQQVVDDTNGDPAQDKLIDAMNDVMSARGMQPSHVLGAPFAIQGPPLEELRTTSAARARTCRSPRASTPRASAAIRAAGSCSPRSRSRAA